MVDWLLSIKIFFVLFVFFIRFTFLDYFFLIVRRFWVGIWVVCFLIYIKIIIFNCIELLFFIFSRIVCILLGIIYLVFWYFCLKINIVNYKFYNKMIIFVRCIFGEKIVIIKSDIMLLVLFMVELSNYFRIWEYI